MTENPEMVANLMQSNPMMRQLTQSNPELQFMLTNPQMLRTILTPENIRMSMAMMQQLQNVPGANPFGMLGMPQPPPSALPTAPGQTIPTTSQPAPGPAPGAVPYTALSTAPSTAPPMVPSTGPSTAPPTAPSTGPSTAPPTVPPAVAPGAGAAPITQFDQATFMQMMQQLGYGPPPGQAGAPTTAPMGTSPLQPSVPVAPAAPAVPVDPKVQYAKQLAQMKEIGFINEQVNIEALKATNGRVDAAVERLLAMIDKQP